MKVTPIHPIFGVHARSWGLPVDAPEEENAPAPASLLPEPAPSAGILEPDALSRLLDVQTAHEEELQSKHAWVDDGDLGREARFLLGVDLETELGEVTSPAPSTAHLEMAVERLTELSRRACLPREPMPPRTNDTW